MPSPPHQPTTAHRAWLLVLALALVELVGSLVVRARVPDQDDWTRAAEHVASQLGPGDALVAAPRWSDPLLREAMGRALGERMTNALAAETGLEGRERLFVLSVRGHVPYWNETPSEDAAIFSRATLEDTTYFGRVRVQRFGLEAQPMLFDFVDGLDGAAVRAGRSDCDRTSMRSGGRGLGEGPVLAADRFSCGGDERSVAETVIEDLTFSARRCISHRPSSAPLVVTFRAVPLEAELVLHAGLHWVSERARDGASVTLRVRAGERLLAELEHHDGDGWASYHVAIPDDLSGTESDLSFEVEGGVPGRPFCWSGRSLGAAPEPRD